MITLITLGYLLPLVVMFLICYSFEETKTIGDLLDCWWMILLPLLNIFLIFIFALISLFDFIESKINKDWWNNFLNKRL